MAFQSPISNKQLSLSMRGVEEVVISSNVAMEENPAYQSVDVAAAKPWTQSSIETNFVWWQLMLEMSAWSVLYAT